MATAPGYLLFMAGRALIGVVIGGFWSMSAATAMRLVPAHQVPRALAIFNGGNALATVLAAPLGSYLGSVIGWRGAFFCLVPIAVLALAWQWISLPSMTVEKRTSGNVLGIFAGLRSRPVALGMAACGSFFMGQFVLFTYIRPFLETVTRVDVATVSLVLLVIGVAGFVGTLLIGRFLGKGLYRTLATIPVLMAVIAAALDPAGSWIAAVVVLLGLWGLMSTAAPVGWWSWLAEAMPHDAEAGGGLMVAVVQTSIAIGSTLGGVLFDSSGYQATFLAAAAILCIAAALSVLASRATPRQAT